MFQLTMITETSGRCTDPEYGTQRCPVPVPDEFNPQSCESAALSEPHPSVTLPGMVDGRGSRRRVAWNRRAIRASIVVALVSGVLGACGAQPVRPPAPTATSTELPQGEWPDESTTGVPPGTELTPFTQECVIEQPGAVIDAKVVNCNLRIRAKNVQITRSRIMGNVNVKPANGDFSFSITESEVDAGQKLITGLGNANFVANRVEIKGGMRGVYCATDCSIENSYVHGQAGDPEGKAHLSGIRMSQNTTVRNNRITCDAPRTPPGSGCSAGLTGYGGFGPVRNNLIEGNLFIGGTSSFCAFGGSTDGKQYSDDARDIRFIDNTFERGPTGKCGNLGAISGFDASAPGSVWKGNTWDDGSPLTPS